MYLHELSTQNIIFKSRYCETIRKPNDFHFCDIKTIGQTRKTNYKELKVTHYKLGGMFCI
jgi:aminoglycoside phosphotransferase family enzyme